ncbi:hypothetical protein [Arsenicibacter rosenii]|uniref:DUF3365 domain-containing protein n=1 Tax=Arsenicibacter rosenii TaxID=1750698 RepID=A0A1S2VH45_9BACT|nr:hypothetical protein [Arsenicibacter rosenii]OIN57740.1 hypothetical protein BLX24_18525 [Arsenicibacter rosenii]
MDVTMFRSIFHGCILAMLIMGCNPDNRIQQTPALKQEMMDKKIKRITNEEINITVDSWGKQIASVAQQELTARLSAKPADIAGLCTLSELPKTRALAKRYAIDINLLSGADVQNTKLPAKEREVLDAYLYNAENKLAQQPNIQKVNDTLYVYNTAVPTDNVICQACFGNQKQPLAVWRLVFHKREVIRRLNQPKK